MLYLLLPLDQHYDQGFGAVADSFKEAAEALNDPAKSPGFHSHLPVSFLYRHAIELYLKSAIIILHRKFDIPYGDQSTPSEASVLVGTRRKPLYSVHGLGPLYAELCLLLGQKSQELASIPGTDWNIPPEVDEWISVIETTDSSSTYFRYPVTKDAAQDTKKSTMQRNDLPQLFDRVHESGKPMKTLLLVNDDDEIVDSFTHDDTRAKELIKVLSAASEFFYGFHAMMSYTLAGGG